MALSTKLKDESSGFISSLLLGARRLPARGYGTGRTARPVNWDNAKIRQITSRSDIQYIRQLCAWPECSSIPDRLKKISGLSNWQRARQYEIIDEITPRSLQDYDDGYSNTFGGCQPEEIFKFTNGKGTPPSVYLGRATSDLWCLAGFIKIAIPRATALCGGSKPVHVKDLSWSPGSEITNRSIR